MNIIEGTIEDKIAGLIFGHALGDAVGLTTEFKSKSDNVSATFPYAAPIRAFPVCDWTDDTDQLILVMKALNISQDPQTLQKNIAESLLYWLNNGFPELGDSEGTDAGGVMKMILENPDFLIDPTGTAKTAWEITGKKLYNNCALTRIAPVAAVKNIDIMRLLAELICKITHYDERCVASCVFLCTCLHLLLYSEDPASSILAQSIEASRSYLSSEIELEFSDWIRRAFTESVSALCLDEIGRISYVFKCLGCAVYALQVINYSIAHDQKPSFEKTILLIANECGDADGNCSVSGAVLGAYLGYNKLPQEWLEVLPNKKWLESLVASFTKRIVEK